MWLDVVIRLALLFFVLTSLTVAPAAAQRAPSSNKQSSAQIDAPKYTGLRDGSTQPKGVKDIGSALISGLNDEKEYGIEEVHKGRVKALWFERIARFDEKGIPYWELMDVLVIPAVSQESSTHLL